MKLLFYKIIPFFPTPLPSVLYILDVYLRTNNQYMPKFIYLDFIIPISFQYFLLPENIFKNWAEN